MTLPTPAELRDLSMQLDAVPTLPTPQHNEAIVRSAIGLRQFVHPDRIR